MLAHLKAKQKDHKPSLLNGMPPSSSNPSPPPAATDSPDASSSLDDAESVAKMTCDALCSLSATASPPPSLTDNHHNIINSEKKSSQGRRPSKSSCPKQHQLPMFLSKTYHMIDKCDPDIATWSDAGDSFVVKNVEKFASSVLPQYFKHSNFSSFARQLNFYGFRKLKAEPILTADFDARTACYVRFYHENFRRHRQDLLVNIRRATKSEQQSKDDVDSMKAEIAKLKEVIGSMSTDFDRRMAEMSYEYNRRITTLSAEYDKLAMLVQQLLTQQGDPRATAVATPGATAAAAAATNGGGVPDMMQSLSRVAAMSLLSRGVPSSSSSSMALGSRPSAAAAAAVSSSTATEVLEPRGEKRPAVNEEPQIEDAGAPSATRPRTGF